MLRNILACRAILFHEKPNEMGQSIDIILEGSEEEFTALFSYSPTLQKSGLTSLKEFIGHAVNQTLQRDNVYGAWAEVLSVKNGYLLKMSSPHHDLSAYKTLIPAWIEAGKYGLQIAQKNKNKIDRVIKSTKEKMKFLLPFGLAMGNVKSVQLLHFPPLTTFVYLDYLFSPTNRRWENLLGYNRVKGVNYASFESIVDCVPLAAPGGDSKGIEPFNNSFIPYVKRMLKARLTPQDGFTQPIVAYGSPVRIWLEKAFPNQIKHELKVLSLLELKLFDDDIITPVLCANHPSMYLYETDKPYSKEKKKILVQDLIAAGWQALMAEHPSDSPKNVLKAMTDYWKGNPRVLKIMNQEDREFSFRP